MSDDESQDDESQAKTDAHVALTYAVSCVKREDQAPAAGRTTADVVESYAMDLLDQLDGSVPRALSAARVACLSAASEVAHPARWRASMRAVDLCRRAAAIASGEAGAGLKPVKPVQGAKTAKAAKAAKAAAKTVKAAKSAQAAKTVTTAKTAKSAIAAKSAKAARKAKQAARSS